MRTVAAVLVLALAGCSFLAVRGPNDPRSGEPVSCTSSRAWPIVDLVWGGALVASGTAAVVEGFAQKRPGKNFEAALGIGVASLTFVVSSLVGFGRVTECRDALAGPAR